MPARGVLTAGIALMCVLWLVPLALMLLNAAKSTTEFALDLHVWSLPSDPATLFHNLADVWTTTGMGPGFVASLVYGLTGSTIAVAAASLAAHSMVRLRLRAPFFWFCFGMAGLLFPLQMYLIPLFRLYNQIGLYDRPLGLILFYAAISSPFCLLVLRGYFATLPVEYTEAARLDGAGEFTIWARIIMPMAKSPIAVLILFQFTWIWNDLIFGLILSASDGVRPITASLAAMQDQFSATGPPLLLAGALLATAPTLLLFLALSGRMMSGLAFTAGRAA